MTRSYYCDICQKVITFDCKNSLKKCTCCSKIFEISGMPSHEINMRKTWSGTTKIEFNTTTMSDDISKRMKNN